MPDSRRGSVNRDLNVLQAIHNVIYNSLDIYYWEYRFILKKCSVLCCKDVFVVFFFNFCGENYVLYICIFVC